MEAEAQAHLAEAVQAEEAPEEATEEEAHPAVEEEAPAVDHPVEARPDLPEDLVDRLLHVTIGAARGTLDPLVGTLEALGVLTLDIHQQNPIKVQRIMDTPRIPHNLTPTHMDTAPAQGKD